MFDRWNVGVRSLGTPAEQFNDAKCHCFDVVGNAVNTTVMVRERSMISWRCALKARTMSNQQDATKKRGHLVVLARLESIVVHRYCLHVVYSKYRYREVGCIAEQPVVYPLMYQGTLQGTGRAAVEYTCQ